MPEDFPIANYDALFATASAFDIRTRVAGQMTPESQAFFFAIYGILYRWRALADADDAFSNIVSSGPHLYAQEASLFAFFTNAVSAVEIICFSAYAFVAWKSPEKFGEFRARPKSITPHSIKRQLQDNFPNVPLTKALVQLITSPTVKELTDIRNRLSHRGTLQRGMVMTLIIEPDDKQAADIDTPLPYSTWDGRRFESSLTSHFRSVLSANMATVFEAFKVFALEATSGSDALGA